MIQCTDINKSGDRIMNDLKEFLQFIADGNGWMLSTGQAKGVIEYINQLELENNRLRANNNHLRISALDAIHFIPSGEVKANLRDAYDETIEQSLHEHDTQVIRNFCNFVLNKYRHDLNNIAKEFIGDNYE